MDIQLVMTILSLLGDIQIPPGAPVQQKLDGVYATWESTASVVYHCPDPSSPINPMGQSVLLSASASTCDISGCSSVAAAMPVVVYPKDMTCQKDYRIAHHKIFESMAAAGQFRLSLPDGSKWTARTATDDEVLQWALDRRGWKILHYPGGDMYSYPNGVFEIYPRTELTFNHPLGSGSNALAALVDALHDHS